MGLSDLRVDILIKKAKKRKRLEELLNDFAQVLRKFDDAINELKKFEEKWGKTEELKIASMEGFLDEYTKILRRLKKPSFIEKVTGRYSEQLADEIMTILLRTGKSILPMGLAYKIIREELGNISFDEFKNIIKKLHEKKVIYSIIINNDTNYLVLPNFIMQANKIIEYMRSQEKQFITLDEAIIELKLEPTEAEILLEELVKIGLFSKEELPRRYWLIR